jgi:hypothetical protein
MADRAVDGCGGHPTLPSPFRQLTAPG